MQLIYTSLYVLLLYPILYLSFRHPERMIRLTKIASNILVYSLELRLLDIEDSQTKLPEQFIMIIVISSNFLIVLFILMFFSFEKTNTLDWIIAYSQIFLACLLFSIGHLSQSLSAFIYVPMSLVVAIVLFGMLIVFRKR